MSDEIKELFIDDVIPDPNQPRKCFDETKLQELAQSISQHGLLQPILVRPLQNDKFQIVHGERRWRACMLLGLKTIKAEPRELDGKQVLEIQLIENLQREDLSPIEEAETFQRMINELGYTHEELGKRIGKSREYVTNKLRLLELHEDIKKALHNGKIKESHARILLPFEESRQKAVFNEILAHGLKVRQVEEIIKANRNVPHETYSAPKEIEIPLLVSLKPNVYSALEQVSNERKLRKESVVSSVVSDYLQKEGYLLTVSKENNQ